MFVSTTVQPPRTAEEWNNRRRIVQFWRKQEGAVIRVAFRPLAQADYLDHLITVSCIYREDTNECYVSWLVILACNQCTAPD